MTPKKTTKKTETQSKFYIAKKVSDARKKLEGKAKEYNEKFVKKQLESGREFIKELKADPIKRIDDLIDDSKDTLKKAKEKRYNAWQKAVKTARTDAKKKFKKINDQGKEVYTGIGNDAKLIIENI
ncbi:MAG: hypothetical protein KJ668_16175, partial [Proteobacteria bacterium]|nr:hypothetical protein [Pseudomonadota bacterium]